MNRMLAFFAVVVVVGVSAIAYGDLVYQQDWDTPETTSANGDPLGLYNWAAHRNQNGVNSINGWPGDPVANSASQARVVDDAAAHTDTDRVFAFWNDGSDGEDLLFWTDDFAPVLLGDYSALALTWYHRNSDAGGNDTVGQRGAVAVDTGSGAQWFAADRNVFNGSGWDPALADLKASSWVPFAFDGTQTLDASGGFDVSGTPQSLPAGAVVAMGVYMELGDDDAGRFDTFALNGTLVPEPATLSLLVLGAAAGMRRRV